MQYESSCLATDALLSVICYSLLEVYTGLNKLVGGHMDMVQILVDSNETCTVLEYVIRT